MRIGPHHDGSELYVSKEVPALGERVRLRVRVPSTYRFETALVRSYHDGEPRFRELRRGLATEFESWWEVDLELTNRITRYRFLFVHSESFEWLSARGLTNHDVHSNSDFQIVASDSRPSWLASSVFYQIFPDRFAKSSEKKLPEWAVARDWRELPRDKTNYTGIEVYGGDLNGVREHLDHIEELGANGIYFTPIFPATSNHRYDASSFDEVDPLLGGDKAWFGLIAAAKRRRIRIVGDITTNHVGANHKWLRKAMAKKSSNERSFFFWTHDFKWGYVGWWDLASLPKLNFKSTELRRRLYSGKNSVIRKWLSPKYGLSGWRVDASNMAGVHKGEDFHDEVMHGIRQALDESHNDAWLVAENGDFAASDLDGRGWHGTMNYQGFYRPFSIWMSDSADLAGGFQGLPIKPPRISGDQLVESITQFNSSIPWHALTASMTLIDSHDTPRFKTIVSGDRDKHLSGVTFLMTYPGIPSIFMGDEIGLEGRSGEDSRRTIDWEDRTNWDFTLLEHFKELVKLRRTQDGLVRGGLRWIDVGADHLLFLRESKRQSLLIFLSRAAASLEIDLAILGYQIDKTLFGVHQEGSHLRIKTDSASQGIWRLRF